MCVHAFAGKENMSEMAPVGNFALAETVFLIPWLPITVTCGCHAVTACSDLLVAMQ